MAAVITVTDNYGTYYYIDSSSASDVLSKAQQDTNALYIRDYCADKYPEWTANAIAAMCGNFAHEGVMNPAQWQYGMDKAPDSGYGIGQWTPSTKILDFLAENGYPSYSMQGEIERIAWEAANNQQWISTTAYPLSMGEFLESEGTPADLASAWLYDWERPGDPGATESARRADADYFYTLFGETPPKPPGPEKSKSGLKPCFYHKYKYD